MITGVEISRGGELVEAEDVDDPLAFVEAYQKRFHAPDLDELPRFNGGLVGYFGYDTVRYIEKRLRKSCPPDRIGTPDILLMVSNEIVVFDNLRGKLHLIVHADPAVDGAFKQAQARLDELENRLHRQTADAPPAPRSTCAAQPWTRATSFPASARTGSKPRWTRSRATCSTVT